MASEEELWHELMACTLTLGDAGFVHQHVVDAYAAQTATEDSKPIAVIFALMGLYLHLDRGFDGRMVQQAHMRLATPRRTWSMPELPEHRGAVRVGDVLEAVPGTEFEVMVDVWCMSVWNCYEHLHGYIAETAAMELGIW
jgi:hypothetical protein